jgi:hypothetical protein
MLKLGIGSTHPTVPRPINPPAYPAEQPALLRQPKHNGRNECRSGRRQAGRVARRGVSMRLKIPPADSASSCESCPIHRQFADILGIGGIHGCHPVYTFSGWRDARDVVGVRDAATRGLWLYTRRGAGLYRRRISSLQLRHSRRRPRHGLHGPQPIPALAGLPRVFQARPGARGSGRSAGRHQACGRAKVPCQAAQSQKASQAARHLISPLPRHRVSCVLESRPVLFAMTRTPLRRLTDVDARKKQNIHRQNASAGTLETTVPKFRSNCSRKGCGCVAQKPTLFAFPWLL